VPESTNDYDTTKSILAW